jgi:hypothetical protein
MRSLPHAKFGGNSPVENEIILCRTLNAGSGFSDWEVGLAQAQGQLRVSAVLQELPSQEFHPLSIPLTFCMRKMLGDQRQEFFRLMKMTTGKGVMPTSLVQRIDAYKPSRG